MKLLRLANVYQYTVPGTRYQVPGIKKTGWDFGQKYIQYFLTIHFSDFLAWL